MRIAKKIIQLVLFTGCLQVVQAQKVNNIEARFIEGKIQVSGDLQTSSPVELSLHWSDDGGTSFNPCLTVNGDLNNQSSGMKTIVWDFSKDGIIMGNFIFKMTAQPLYQRTVTPVSNSVKREKKPEMSGHKPPLNKSHFLLMAGIAAGPTLSGTFTVGFSPGKWGGYAKVKSNFATKGDTQIGNPDDYFFIDNFSKTGRFSLSAGVTGQLINALFIYAGVGYGSKWVQWKTTSDQLITIDEMSFSAIDPELGLILKTGNFLISAGASALIGTQTSIEANISLGFIF